MVGDRKAAAMEGEEREKGEAEAAGEVVRARPFSIQRDGLRIQSPSSRRPHRSREGRLANAKASCRHVKPRGGQSGLE